MLAHWHVQVKARQPRLVIGFLTTWEDWVLYRNIWRSSISMSTKLHLYSVYVLPVILYGADTWTMTKAMSAKVFDQ